MNPERTALEILNATPSNKRPKERPQKRWKDCVDEDFAIVKTVVAKRLWSRASGRSVTGSSPGATEDYMRKRLMNVKSVEAQIPPVAW
ncbi:hypothetical protein TNCV_1800271 [Trichonephila clavipes]|nr:hypothetical protein TNCV_1800271 [Trichonephila clavipes]